MVQVVDRGTMTQRDFPYLSRVGTLLSVDAVLDVTDECQRSEPPVELVRVALLTMNRGRLVAIEELVNGSPVVVLTYYYDNSFYPANLLAVQRNFGLKPERLRELADFYYDPKGVS